MKTVILNTTISLTLIPMILLVAPANAILGHFSDGTLRKDNVSSIVMNSLFAGAIDPIKEKELLQNF